MDDVEALESAVLFPFCVERDAELDPASAQRAIKDSSKVAVKVVADSIERGKVAIVMIDKGVFREGTFESRLTLLAKGDRNGVGSGEVDPTELSGGVAFVFFTPLFTLLLFKAMLTLATSIDSVEFELDRLVLLEERAESSGWEIGVEIATREGAAVGLDEGLVILEPALDIAGEIGAEAIEARMFEKMESGLVGRVALF